MARPMPATTPKTHHVTGRLPSRQNGRSKWGLAHISLKFLDSRVRTESPLHVCPRTDRAIQPLGPGHLYEAQAEIDSNVGRIRSSSPRKEKGCWRHARQVINPRQCSLGCESLSKMLRTPDVFPHLKASQRLWASESIRAHSTDESPSLRLNDYEIDPRLTRAREPLFVTFERNSWTTSVRTALSHVVSVPQGNNLWTIIHGH